MVSVINKPEILAYCRSLQSILLLVSILCKIVRYPFANLTRTFSKKLLGTMQLREILIFLRADPVAGHRVQK